MVNSTSGEATPGASLHHSFLEAALGYIAEGLRVLPLKPLGKQPLTRHGVNDASCDPEQVRRWAQAHPTANVGIACGNGLLVVDVDPRNGGNESFAKLKAEHGVQRTKIVSTPNGGIHLYYNCPADVAFRSRKNVLPGIDLQADGAYVVAPPSSLHTADHKYGLATGAITAPAPQWLLSLTSTRNEADSLTPEHMAHFAAPGETIEARVNTVRELLRHIPNDESMNRERWVGMAFRVRAACGLDADELAFEAFDEWTRGWTGGYDSDETRRVWETLGDQREARGYGALLTIALQHGYTLPPDHPDHAQNEFEADLPPASPIDGNAVFASLADLLKCPELLEAPACVVPRIAYRGRLSIFAAPAKSGKSTLLAHAAAAVSRQGSFFNEATTTRHGGTTVWVGIEEAVGDAVRRFSELGADPAKVILVVNPGKDLLAETEQLLAARPADLLVLDSLQEYARVTTGSAPGDGDNAAWAKVIRPLVELSRKHDVAIVVLHHVRRSDGEERGAGEIAAAADAILIMRPSTTTDPTLRHISGRGRWTIEPFDAALRDGQYVLAGAAPLPLDTRVLLFIESNPGKSKTAVAQGVGGRKTYVLKSIERLIVQGRIEPRENRLYARQPGTEFITEDGCPPALDDVIDAHAVEDSEAA